MQTFRDTTPSRMERRFGCIIRARYHYAKVRGDEILYRGKPTTPARLANQITGTRRNAWRDLWIKRPTVDGWIPADVLRVDTAAIWRELDIRDDQSATSGLKNRDEGQP